MSIQGRLPFYKLELFKNRLRKDDSSSQNKTVGYYLSSLLELRHDKINKATVRPAKTQISLGICPVWSEYSLCAQWVAKNQIFLYADSKDSDQTRRMLRLIWVFAGRTFILLVLSCRGSLTLVVKQEILIDWFCFSCMQANSNKFQAIAVAKRTHEKSPTFNFGSINITCDEVVKLLGIDIDSRLSFDNHISNICKKKKKKKKKTAQQLNILETNWEPPE